MTRKVRVPDLQVVFQPDTSFLVKSMTRGVGARVPMQAIGVLALCGVPRTADEVAQALGDPGRRLFEGLVGAGLLVDPDDAADTPVFFDNFAAVDVHRKMIGDTARIEAYWRAISSVVRPGMAVLDAGTGSGVLACMAAKAGARVVYAVDRSDLLDLARDVVSRSGFDGVVKCLRGDFGQIQLPEPVDVVVTETFGAMALAEGATDDLRACVARNLAPGGRVIPDGIDLFLAPVGDRALHDETVGVFGSVHGAELSPLRALATRRSRNLDLAPTSLLAPGRPWAALKWPDEGTVDARVEFDGLPAGTLTGLCGWYALRLADGVILPTGPNDPVTHWGQTYLPFDPVAVSAGDTLAIDAVLAPADEDRRTTRLGGTWTLGGASGAFDFRVR